MEGDTRFGFALFAAVALAGALLVVLIRDPSEVSALSAEINRLNEARDRETVRTNAELRNLQEALRQSQDAQTAVQKELLNVLEALRQARDQLVLTPSSSPRGMPAEAIRGQPAPVGPKVDGASSPSVAEELSGVRLQLELAAIRRAVVQNAREYLPLADEIAKARCSLAMAKREAAAPMPEEEGEARQQWRLSYLNSEEAAELELAHRQAAPAESPMPTEPKALVWEIASSAQMLRAAQQRLSTGQRTLSALQGELSRLQRG